MKRLLTMLMLCILAFSLTACFSKKYMITTSSGQQYISNGSPEYDVQSETYKFKDEEGKRVILNQEDIEVIKEQ